MTDSREAQGYAELVALLKQFREFRKPVVRDGAPDYSPAAMERQSRGLGKYQRRLAAIDSSRWPVSKQVDYHLVRAQMNGLEFHHRALRPWFRDPAFYVTVAIQFAHRLHGAISPRMLLSPPANLDELEVSLKAVPAILEQARENLTEAGGDLTMLGIRLKKREAEIYRKCITALQERNSGLVADARKALRATESFGKWLRQNRKRMDAPSGIGIENYNWHLKHVQLIPYDWNEMMTISEREYGRTIAMMKFEEHRNRNLPPMIPESSAEGLIRLGKRARRELWKYLREGEVLTPPDYMKPKWKFGKAGKPGGKRDYFENILHRDPLPLIPHDVVGHTPDAVREKRDRRPVRGTGISHFVDSFRAEGLATGIEEILMQTGMLDKRPRSRELTYNLVAHRAARSIADLKMHSNEFTFAQAFDHVVEKTPYGWQLPGGRVMWGDIELYLRQPSYGTAYTVGATQLQKLIADRAMQQGKSFNLRSFMDRFLGLGMIPITLARWEMTGLDDEIRKLNACNAR